jgi:hypothetical protein
VIFAHLIQTASNSPTDVSALESSISALETAISALEADIRALDNRPVPWEHALPWFTAMVIVGVALEWWVIHRDFREEMETWALEHFGVIRSTPRPSVGKLAVEIISVALIVLGIFGELGTGLAISSINSSLRAKNAVLRSKNAELRSKSDQLLALVTQQTSDANARVAEANRQAAEANRKSENERLARVKIEAAVAFRSLDDKQKRDIGAALASFNSKAGASIWFNGSSTEAEMFADDIAEALRFGHITTSAPGGIMEMQESGKWNGEIKSVQTGVVVQSTKAPAAIEFAAALIKQLNDRGFDAKRQTEPPFDEKTTEPIIWVNVEPRPKGPQGEYKLQAEREAKAKNKQVQNSQTAKP